LSACQNEQIKQVGNFFIDHTLPREIPMKRFTAFALCLLFLSWIGGAMHRTCLNSRPDRPTSAPTLLRRGPSLLRYRRCKAAVDDCIALHEAVLRTIPATVKP
jgi:hypothetical protein